MKPFLIITLIAAAFSGAARAAILVQDSFPSNGSLVGTTPAVGGVWQYLSGTANSLLVFGNRLQIQDNSTEDAASAFASVTSLDAYAGFTLSMSSLDLPSPGGDYFASFRSASSYVGQIFSLAPTGTATGKFRLGVANNFSGTTSVWGSDLDPGTDYRVVVKFTQSGANDFVTLWVGPSSEASASVSTTAAAISADLAGFAFRQTASTGDLAIADLVVGQTFAEVVPEPQTWALVALGVAAVIRRNRRR